MKKFVDRNWAQFWDPTVKTKWQNDKTKKLWPKYYGPYWVIEPIGQVAYKWEFPEKATIQPIFPVSQLKALAPTQEVHMNPLM